MVRQLDACYLRALTYGLIGVRDAAQQDERERCLFEARHLAVLPGLIREPVLARHQDYLDDDVQIYLQGHNRWVDSNPAFKAAGAGPVLAGTWKNIQNLVQGRQVRLPPLYFLPDRPSPVDHLCFKLIILGVASIQQAVFDGDLALCGRHAEVLHNVPSLIAEPNLLRHHYHLQNERQAFVDYILSSGRPDLLSLAKRTYAPCWEKIQETIGPK